ncbi:MAG: hypothetical protein ACTHLB_09315, partial [Parafilimonas sp.]
MRKLLFLLLAVSTWYACTKTGESPVTSSDPIQSSEQSSATTKPKRILLKQGGDLGLYINGKNFSYSPGVTFVLAGQW